MKKLIGLIAVLVIGLLMNANVAAGFSAWTVVILLIGFVQVQADLPRCP